MTKERLLKLLGEIRERADDYENENQLVYKVIVELIEILLDERNID